MPLGQLINMFGLFSQVDDFQGFLQRGTLALQIECVLQIANLLQTGFIMTGTPLIPDINKLNPLTGLKRIFSKRGMMELSE